MVKRNILIYLLSQFCHSLIFTIPIWIVYYQAKLSVVEVSILVTLNYIIQMAFELPSGALADMIGRRFTIFLGYLIGGISFLLFPFATTFWHFALLLFGAAILDAFKSGAEEAIVYDTLKENGKVQEFKKVYAKSNVVYQIGLITATAIGGILFGINEHLPYILYGIALLIGAVGTYFYIEPHIDSEKFTIRGYFNQMKLGSQEAFKNSYTTWLSLFYIAVAGIAWSSTLYFNEFMMIRLVPDASSRGIITSIMRLANVVLISALLQNEKLFNKTRTILFFPIIMLIAYLPGVFLNGYTGLPFVQAAMIATTARWTILSPLTNEVFSSKYRATAISLLSLLIGVVYITLTGVSGFVINEYGIEMMYSVLGIISFIIIVPLSIKLIIISKGKFSLSE